MTNRHAFALAYLFGTAAGILGGLLLPWYLSGGVAWCLGGLTIFATYYWPIVVRMDVSFVRDIPTTATAIRWAAASRRKTVQAVVGGVFFGALAGALAADVPEFADAFLWPGHDRDGCLAALVVALAWLLGEECTPQDGDAGFRPGRVGLALWAVVLLLCALPVLWEVWS